MIVKNNKSLLALAIGIMIIATCMNGLNSVYAIPPKINYQGYLTDINGIPLNQTIDMTFKIYDQIEEGSVLWQEAHKAVVIEDGIFKAYLGEITPITEDLFIADRFIGVTLGDEPEMQPRSQFTSSPYAFIAAKAISVPDHSINSQQIAAQAVITEKIADNAVTTQKIADGSITNSKISEHTIDITKLNFTPLMKEVDPQVGEMNTNDIPKWDGSALVSGSIHDTGEHVGISTNDPKETLDVSGAIKIGNTDRENPGSIRWTGDDFEGFNEKEWVSLTKKNNDINGTVITAIAGEAISGAITPAPVYIRKDGLIIEQNNGDSKANVYGVYKFAQKFVTDIGTKELHKISLKLEKFGAPPGDIDVSINAITDNTFPDTTSVIAVSITANEIANGWNDFVFEPVLSVKPYSEYAIVISNKNGDINNHIKCFYLNSNIYNSGCCLKSDNYGVNWTKEEDKDIAFRIYSENRVFACSANALSNIDFLGFAITDVDEGQSVEVQTSGIVSGFKGLIIGEKYYLQDNTGEIGIQQGTNMKLIGMAISHSELSMFWSDSLEIATKEEALSGINDTKIMTSKKTKDVLSTVLNTINVLRSDMNKNVSSLKQEIAQSKVSVTQEIFNTKKISSGSISLEKPGKNLTTSKDASIGFQPKLIIFRWDGKFITYWDANNGSSSGGLLWLSNPAQVTEHLSVEYSIHSSTLRISVTDIDGYSYTRPTTPTLPSAISWIAWR